MGKVSWYIPDSFNTHNSPYSVFDLPLALLFII